MPEDATRQFTAPRAGRRGAQPRPAGHQAEIVLRLLLLKHIRNRSYAVLERDVRANLL
jgi:hypothetical protein